MNIGLQLFPYVWNKSTLQQLWEVLGFFTEDMPAYTYDTFDITCIMPSQRKFSTSQVENK